MRFIKFLLKLAALAAAASVAYKVYQNRMNADFEPVWDDYLAHEDDFETLEPVQKAKL